MFTRFIACLEGAKFELNNRNQAQKPRHDWGREKNPVIAMTGKSKLDTIYSLISIGLAIIILSGVTLHV